MLSLGTLLPLKLRRSALSRALPTGMAVLALHLLPVLSVTLTMCAILSLSGGCLPGRNVERHVASMGSVMTSVLWPLPRWPTCFTRS